MPTTVGASTSCRRRRRRWRRRARTQASIGAVEEALALVPKDDPVARARPHRQDRQRQAPDRRAIGVSGALLVRTLESLESENPAVAPLLVEIAFNDYWRGEFALARTLPAR